MSKEPSAESACNLDRILSNGVGRIKRDLAYATELVERAVGKVERCGCCGRKHETGNTILEEGFKNDRCGGEVQGRVIGGPDQLGEWLLHWTKSCYLDFKLGESSSDGLSGKMPKERPFAT